MVEDIGSLGALVDAVSDKIVESLKNGDTTFLKEILWWVPTKILSEFLTREKE
jgi:hypothetical protein